MINRLIKPGNRKFILQISAVFFKLGTKVPKPFENLHNLHWLSCSYLCYVSIHLSYLLFECSLDFHLYIKLYCSVFRSSVRKISPSKHGLYLFGSRLGTCLSSNPWCSCCFCCCLSTMLVYPKKMFRDIDLLPISHVFFVKKKSTTGIDPGHHKAIL